MTAIPQRRVPTPPTQTRRLAPSQRLLDPLHLVAGRVRLLSFLRAFFQLIVLTLGVWLVLSLFLGSIREIPVPFAIALASLAWLSLFGGIVWFFRPVLRHADLSSTARLIDAALPDTDERISSALELTQETDPRFQGSTEL